MSLKKIKDTKLALEDLKVIDWRKNTYFLMEKLIELER
jgi:hypothetical protein